MEAEVRESPRQHRREFVNAVAEHLWVRPGTDRPTVKPPILLLLTALATAGAVATGLILTMLHRGDPRPAAAASTTAAPTTWSAVGGWDCAADSTRGFDAVGRTRAWYVVADGGWDRDGCDGSFVAVPMSGSAQENQAQYAVWTFAPGDSYRSCEVSAYVPKVLRLRDAAATAVHYAVQAGTSGIPMAEVTVNQPANAGRWVVIGTYPVGRDGLSVRLSNQGRPAIADGRIAVAQFRARCTG